MEGQTQLVCRDCGLTASVSGEFPDEYQQCFVTVIQRDGWVVAPGTRVDMVCGACLAAYKGSETRDDEEKLQGGRDPKGA